MIYLINSKFGAFVDRNYPIELKDTTDRARSVSYLQLEIDSDDWLTTKLYDK